MRIFQIENISFEPLTVIAGDFDAAADVFMDGLKAGLGMARAEHRDKYHWRLVKSGQPGVVWSIGQGRTWKLFSTNRSDERE